MPDTVWTTRRKWMGNVVPSIVAAPFLLAGSALALVVGDSAAMGGGIVAIGLLLGLVVLNRVGLYENEPMRKELRAKFGDRAKGRFVGFASPAYRSALDPHEDVGFLDLCADDLVYIGERRTVQLPRSAIRRVTFRPNPHTWVGLGGWISIEGTLEGRPIRMLIEPREAKTLLGNKRLARVLRAELEEWRQDRPGPMRDDPAASL